MIKQTKLNCSFHFLQIFLLSTAITTSIPVIAKTISPNTSLFTSNTTQTWSSSNNTFSLSFKQVGSTTSYIAGIFYVGGGGIPIWTAGGGRGTVVDSGGAIHFVTNGSLYLVNGSGFVLWNSNTANRGVSSASLDDNGNLALRRGNVTVWSSFDNPTDSLVPYQNFTVNQTLTSGSDYSFRLLSSGNLTLIWRDNVVYWNERLGYNLTSPTLQLQSNGILSLFDASLSGSMIVAYSNDYGEGSDVLRFIRLDSDGNFRMYSSSRDNGVTTMTWAFVEDQCQVYGYCGNLGICSYVGSSPVCGCPSRNFEAVDVNDRRKGCRRKVGLGNCTASVTLLELNDTKFLTFDADEMLIIGIQACKSNCLTSPSCVAASSLSDGSGYCYIKNSGLVSGYQSPVSLGTSFVKVCGSVEPNPDILTCAGGGGNRWKTQVWIVGGAILVTMMVVAVLVGGFWWCCCRNDGRFGGHWAQYSFLDYASGTPVQFSYKDLHRASKGFEEKLGEGGFGAVYKGVLSNKMVVAMKQLEGIEQGERQFRMEVAMISTTHHLNLVRLIGFCSERRHRILVYEFMKNGSLDSFLFPSEVQSKKPLDWKQRFSIALGTARGITYLHEECRDCIIHCDIKSENILLDENYNAKVSDFGLAKLINPKEHRGRSLISVRGTRGYLAPEWLANLPITSKSDVYSYGMLLLEIVSGRRNFEVSTDTNQRRFSMWAYEEFEKGNVYSIIDKRLFDQDLDTEQATRAIQISFWCIQEHPSQRPTMGKVVQMLEGVIGFRGAPQPTPTPKGRLEGLSVATSSNSSRQDSSNPSTYAATDESQVAAGMNAERASSPLLKSPQIEDQRDHISIS